MADRKAADTRIEGATDDVAINGMTPAAETIQAFAREIVQVRLWRGGGEAVLPRLLEWGLGHGR